MTQLRLQDACTADALKEQGFARVAIHADNFLAIMRAAARRISDESGFVSSDNLRVLADALGLVPHTPHAWGSVFVQKPWKAIGRQRSKYPSNHGRFITVWRWDDDNH